MAKITVQGVLKNRKETNVTELTSYHLQEIMQPLDRKDQPRRQVALRLHLFKWICLLCFIACDRININLN